MICGAMAGTVAKTVLYPLDMVRHRLQVCLFSDMCFFPLMITLSLNNSIAHMYTAVALFYKAIKCLHLLCVLELLTQHFS